MATAPHFETVSHAQSESLIAAVEHTAAGPLEGIFGPRSVSWKINRESALFLGAGRAALLQLAHPWVATALEQHSSLMAQPIARFHSTFRIVFTMIFGSLGQATAAARQLHAMHTGVRGEIQEDVARWRRGSHYQANEVAALRWVYATLVESAVLAYQLVLSPLGAEELARYYAESRTLAGLFGLPADALPEDWNGFITYCRQMEQSDELGVSTTSREMANGLLRGAGSWIKPPAWYCALTTYWLAPRLREEFGLPFGQPERDRRERAQRWLPGVYRALPSAVRFVGPWREAKARLAGAMPGAFTRASNRFWTGEFRLPFRDR